MSVSRIRRSLNRLAVHYGSNLLQILVSEMSVTEIYSILEEKLKGISTSHQKGKKRKKNIAKLTQKVNPQFQVEVEDTNGDEEEEFEEEEEDLAPKRARTSAVHLEDIKEKTKLTCESKVELGENTNGDEEEFEDEEDRTSGFQHANTDEETDLTCEEVIENTSERENEDVDSMEEFIDDRDYESEGSEDYKPPQKSNGVKNRNKGHTKIKKVPSKLQIQKAKRKKQQIYHRLVAKLRPFASRRGLTPAELLREFQCFSYEHVQDDSEQCICGKTKIKHIYHLRNTKIEDPIKRALYHTVQVGSVCKDSFQESRLSQKAAICIIQKFQHNQGVSVEYVGCMEKERKILFKIPKRLHTLRKAILGWHWELEYSMPFIEDEGKLFLVVTVPTDLKVAWGKLRKMFSKGQKRCKLLSNIAMSEPKTEKGKIKCQFNVQRIIKQ